MAQITYMFKPGKNNAVWCTGQITLSCGYKIKEKFLARTQALGMRAVSELIGVRTEEHIQSCDKKH